MTKQQPLEAHLEWIEAARAVVVAALFYGADTLTLLARMLRRELGEDSSRVDDTRMGRLVGNPRRRQGASGGEVDEPRHVLPRHEGEVSSAVDNRQSAESHEAAAIEKQ